MTYKKLAGKTAIITGANQGLGLQIARQFLLNGASVAICARDGGKLQAVEKELRELISYEHQTVATQVVDVADYEQCCEFFSFAKKKLEKVDILVNNAAIHGPYGKLHDVKITRWQEAINVNLLGVMYMSQLAISEMLTQGEGKIINLSGGGATAPMPYFSAYAAAKAAVVRLTETWAEEYRENKISFNAIAPGALNTRLLDQVLAAGADEVGKENWEKAKKQEASGGASLTQAANLCVWLASNESDGVTGKIISAVWDPWQDLAKHREELLGDVYTLRRIVPRDRGYNWGER